MLCAQKIGFFSIFPSIAAVSMTHTTNFLQEDEFKGRHLAAIYTFEGRLSGNSSTVER